MRRNVVQDGAAWTGNHMRRCYAASCMSRAHPSLRLHACMNAVHCHQQASMQAMVPCMMQNHNGAIWPCMVLLHAREARWSSLSGGCRGLTLPRSGAGSTAA